MSMDRCVSCSQAVDTDTDAECYVGDVCYCERCRDRIEFCEHERDAQKCGECNGPFGVGA